MVRSLKKDELNRHVMILDLYPDQDPRQFNGFEYASGCQNLFSRPSSTHDSARVQHEEEKKEAKKDGTKRDKPTFNLYEL